MNVKMLYGDIVEKSGDSDGQDRIVSGFFTDDKVDLHGHIISRDAMVQAVAEYDKWRNVREMHRDVVGVAVSVGEKAWNWIDAKIIKDDTWKLIQEGAYKGFSVGIIVTNGEWLDVEDVPAWAWEDVSESVKGAIQEFGYVFHITGVELVEVSVVDRPANPRAVIESNKGLFGGADRAAVLPSVVSGYMEISKAFGLPYPVASQEEQVEDNEKVVDATVENVVDESVVETEEEVVETEEKVVETTDVDSEPVDNETEEKQVDVDIMYKILDKLEKLQESLDELSERDNEVDVDEIAEKVVSVIESRKATVNTGEEPVVEQAPRDLKELSRHELADMIAKAASKRAGL